VAIAAPIRSQAFRRASRTLVGMSVSTPEERLRIALEMADLGEQMVRARLCREHPDWTDADVQAAIARWRADRPDAPFGDYPGPRSDRVIPSGSR